MPFPSLRCRLAPAFRVQAEGTSPLLACQGHRPHWFSEADSAHQRHQPREIEHRGGEQGLHPVPEHAEVTAAPQPVAALSLPNFCSTL